ncbi:antitoxin [ANME-1 cluster archaeon ex4572_4]|nr:MAG: antitoxin [ANME-1 cluster archaeon ex4572_4]
MGRIVMDEGVCRGKPVIKGTRLTVEFVLELLANGWSTAGITENYPQLKEEDIFAALHYATSLLKEESIYLLPRDSQETKEEEDEILGR